MEFSRPDNARQINRSRVLNALKEKDDLSRADLSRILILNKVSVSEIVAALIKEGLIIETHLMQGENGRPGTALRIKKDASYTIGIDIGSRAIRACLFDLKGNAIRFEQVPTSAAKSLEEIRTDILKSLQRMLKNSQTPILGLCVAVNGIVDEQKGIICSTPSREEENIDVKGLLSALPFPVMVSSALKSQAEAERNYYQRDLERFLFINWGEHLASAFITKSEIIENQEFGHMPISKQGLCHCGAIGCLELHSSGWGISHQAEEKLGKELSVKALCKETGGEEIIRDAADTLARALVTAGQATGANAFLLGGGISLLDDSYFAAMQQSFSKLAPSRRADTPIYRAGFGEKGTVQGAGLLALDTYFYQGRLLRSIGMYPDIDRQ